MFVMSFSSFWISRGLYPSVVVSEVFLSKRRVRKLKGFRPSVISLVCVLAYMGSFISIMRQWRGCTLSAGKNFCGPSSGFLFVFCGLFVVGLVFRALFLRFLGALLCWLA